MKKRIITLIIAVAVLASIIPVYSSEPEYKVFEFSGETLVIQAEEEGVEVSQPWEPDGTESESDGGCMKVASSLGMRSSITRDEPGNLRFHINIPEQTRYQVWIRYKALDTNSDSYYFRIDNSNWTTMWLTGADEWKWGNLGLEFFTVGEHVIDIAHRELGFKVDKVIITSLPDYNPNGDSYSTPIFLPEVGETMDTPYNLPAYTPPKEHPRVLLRASDIPRIKSNLTHPQNIEVYEYLVGRSKLETDGNLGLLGNGASSNMNLSLLECIEANAFLYLMDNDVEKGKRAVELVKNMITTLVNRKSNQDTATRTGGQAIFVASLVYDWCYYLISDEDKALIRQYAFFHASLMEVGWPPIHGGYVLGHDVEAQLNKDLLAAGIAFYDEDPKIYNIVAGRILNEMIPAKNQAYKSFSMSEGPSYGRFRYAFELICAYLFKGMGYDNIYDKTQINPAYGLIFARKPDGKFVPTGDDVTKSVYGYDGTYGSVFFMAGNLYKDPFIKREYYRGVVNGKSISTVISDVSAVMHLIINDVTVAPDATFRDFPLTVYSGGNINIMTARTSWDEGADADNFMVQINAGGYNYGNHQHMDAGHFDIYYKGALAIDSGLYESASFFDENGKQVTSLNYASLHDMNYHKRTVAHNSMLVIDPKETVKSAYTSHADGGQKLISGSGYEPTHRSDMIKEENKMSEVLSYGFGPDPVKPAYSYIKTDLSPAYGYKVNKYERSFMYLNFFDNEYPGALIVLDDIASKDAAFKKSWLLHSEEEPVIDGNTAVIERNQYEYHGRLTNETLLPEKYVIEKIGGENQRFLSNGTNFKAVSKTKTQEEGNWRLEISPAQKAEDDLFLNVMWVSDSEDNQEPLKAQLLQKDDDYVGVRIKDRAVYFARKNKPHMNNIKINSGNDGKDVMHIVTGLRDGKWTVYSKDGKKVTECFSEKEQNIVSFTLPADEYTLKWSYAKTNQTDISFFANINKAENSPIDIRINNMFVSFENKPFKEDGILYLPYSELIEKIYTDNEKTDEGYEIESGVLKLNYNENQIELSGEKFSIGKILEVNEIIYVDAAKIINALKQQITETLPDVYFIKTSTVASDSYNLVNSNAPGRIKLKKVTATLNSSSSAYDALDDNKISYWSALGLDEWIQFEFEKVEKLTKLELLWNVGNTRVQTFELYASNDGENWEQIFNGCSDGKTEGFETLKLDIPKECKFVKLVGRGNTSNSWNSLCEIHFFNGEEEKGE